MQILVLLGFIITQVFQEVWPIPVVWLSAAVGVYLLALAGLMGADRRLNLPGRAGNDPRRNRHVERRHRLFALLIRLWLLGGMAGLVAVGYKRWLIGWMPEVPLLGTWIALGPFVAALLLMWWLEYPFHRAMRLRAGDAPVRLWTRGQYLLYNVRHHLLFILVPVSFILLGADAILLYLYPHLPAGATGELVSIGLTFVWAGLIFLLAPLLIVRIWKTRPLPRGEARDRLEALCRQLGIRYRDLLVWESDGVLANAGAMGLIGPVRYILLSDALIEQMPAPSVEAVLAHEVAHIREHHIFFAGLFAFASVLLCSAAAWGLAELLGAGMEVEGWLSLMLLAGVWAVGFGCVSKSFERQSDALGAWASGPGRPPDDPRDRSITPQGATLYAGALQQVADLNGIPMTQRNWRHGPMADRIQRIHYLGYVVGSREPADRTGRRIKRALLGGLMLGAALLAWRLVLES